VPLTFTTQSEANFSQTQASLWMKDSEDHVTVSSLPPKDQWVIFNLQQAAYYRVNYDDHNWNLIIQQLKKDHQVISPVNRGQIVDDAMNLARAGTVIFIFLLVFLSSTKELYSCFQCIYGYSRVTIIFLSVLLKNVIFSYTNAQGVNVYF